jgi:ABC-type phosphate transport system substrate-binding protein
VVERQVLGRTAYTSTAKELRTTFAEVAEIARDRGAIGYVGTGVVQAAEGKVRAVKAPDVSRPLGFVTVGEPSPDVKKFFDFLQRADVKRLIKE